MKKHPFTNGLKHTSIILVLISSCKLTFVESYDLDLAEVNAGLHGDLDGAAGNLLFGEVDGHHISPGVNRLVLHLEGSIFLVGGLDRDVAPVAVGESDADVPRPRRGAVHNEVGLDVGLDPLLHPGAIDLDIGRLTGLSNLDL